MSEAQPQQHQASKCGRYLYMILATQRRSNYGAVRSGVWFLLAFQAVRLFCVRVSSPHLGENSYPGVVLLFNRSARVLPVKQYPSADMSFRSPEGCWGPVLSFSSCRFGNLAKSVLMHGMVTHYYSTAERGALLSVCSPKTNRLRARVQGRPKQGKTGRVKINNCARWPIRTAFARFLDRAIDV